MDTIAFGDTVRISTTETTAQLGIAGLLGLVYGSTTPSITGVQVIGHIANDRAFSVEVEGRNDPLWIDPHLLEFVDHTPGTTVVIGKKRYTRGEDGDWNNETKADDGKR